MRDVDDVLAHYGIPGMKWGRRNVRSKTLTPKRQLIRDEKNLEYLNNGGHARIGLTKKRQEMYDKKDKDYLEKNIAKNKTKLAEKQKTKETKPDTRSEDRKQKDTIKKKKLSEMSNAELKTLNTRLQLEKQYKELIKEDLSPGRRLVMDLLVTNSKQTANHYVQKGMRNGAEAAVKKVLTM